MMGYKKIINTFFRYAPNSMVYLRHKFNNKEGLQEWVKEEPFFLHIPKSAGTSICRAMHIQESGHFPYRDIVTMYPEVESKENYFTIFREPVSRLVSTFKYAHMLEEKYGTTTLSSITKYVTFEAFVIDYLQKKDIDSHYFLRQASTFLEGVDKDRLTVINFSYLQQGFDLYFERLGKRALIIPRKNIACVKKDIDLTVSKETKDIVCKIYKQDVNIEIEIQGKALLKGLSTAK